MDPLQLLRDFTMRGELSSVTLSEKEVDFGDRYSFARSAITGYKSQKGTGQNYTLETVLFFLKNKNMQHTAYMKKARESKVSAVSFIDSQDLSNYLTGATDSSDYIDFASYERLGAAAGSHGQPPAKRPRPDGGAADDSLEAVPAPGSVEDSALQEIINRERELRDRNSQLTTPNKDLSRVLDLAKRSDRGKLKAQTQSRSRTSSREHPRHPQRHTPSSSSAKPEAAPQLPIKPSGRFDRSDMQHSAMAKDIDKLGINPYGLQQPSRQRQERAEERRPVPKVPPGFEPSGSGKHRAAAAAPPPPPPPPRATHGSSQRHSSSSHAAASSSRAGPKADLRRVPIVLVPAASSAKINMFNARSFLEEGAFKTAEQCKAEGVQRAPLLSIKRTVDRKAPVEYHVTDKLPPKHSSEWQRVVAVFVHGVAWQFKDFPEKGASKGDLVDTFLKYLGVYIHYHNEEVPSLVKGWKVEKLQLHRDNRYNDAQLMRSFWRKLDIFLKEKQSKLAY